MYFKVKHYEVIKESNVHIENGEKGSKYAKKRHTVEIYGDIYCTAKSVINRTKHDCLLLLESF
jgi:hypothetical protein